MKKNMKRYNYLLLVSAVIFSLLLAEFVLITLNYEYTPLKIIHDNDLGRLGTMPQKMDFVYDPHLFWRPKTKGTAIFNTQGFVGPEINETNFQFYKIFAIGDSNTLGLHPMDEVSWPSYLGESLKKDYEDILVINAGVFGYTSFQGLARFKQVLPYNPNIVLISFGQNDLQRVYIPDKEWNKRSIFLSKLLLKLRLYHLIKSVSDKIRVVMNKESNLGLVPRVSLEDYEKNILEIVSLSKTENISVVLLTRPFVKTRNSLWMTPVLEYNYRTIKIAKENNITYVDVYSFFKNKNDLFGDYQHFNEKGNKIMAKLVHRYLKKRL